MSISINNIIETLCNPAGRFTSLEGIRLKPDEHGEAMFSFSGKTVDFQVWWNEESYVLKCCMREQSGIQISPEKINAILDGYSCSYLVDYRFLPAEMLIFDNMGTAHSVDVTLMKMPEGMPMDKFLVRACDDRNYRLLKKLKEEFCLRGVWLLKQHIVHRRIRPSNIIVSPEGVPTLINYEAMVTVEPGVNDESALADNLSIAALTLGIVMLRHNPSFYRLFRQTYVFKLPVLREGILALMEESAVEAGCAEVVEIVRLLAGTSSSLSSSGALAKALGKLAADDTPLIIDPQRAISVSRALFEPAGLPFEGSEHKKEGGLNLTEYDFVGSYCEELICVSQRDRWGFVDKHGAVMIPLRYQWASDFEEGRAVVIYDDYHAMINKEGHEILPAIYESIDWDCHNSIAKVMLDGLYGLYGREGEELVAPRYEWMGETLDELILVKENGLYGYIRRNGDMVITTRYDDASSFNDEGLASVVLGGESCMIDTTGTISRHGCCRESTF